MKKIILSSLLGLALTCVVTESWGGGGAEFASQEQRAEEAKVKREADIQLFSAATNTSASPVEITEEIDEAISKGAGVNDRYNGENESLNRKGGLTGDTALHLAARASNLTAVSALLARGANPLTENNNHLKASELTDDETIKNVLIDGENTVTANAIQNASD